MNVEFPGAEFHVRVERTEEVVRKYAFQQRFKLCLERAEIDVFCHDRAVEERFLDGALTLGVECLQDAPDHLEFLDIIGLLAQLRRLEQLNCRDGFSEGRQPPIAFSEISVRPPELRFQPFNVRLSPFVPAAVEHNWVSRQKFLDELFRIGEVIERLNAEGGAYLT